MAPTPKYDLAVYPFGIIFDRHLVEDISDGSYWQYQIQKAGRQFKFWYAETEVDKWVNVNKELKEDMSCIS